MPLSLAPLRQRFVDDPSAPVPRRIERVRAVEVQQLHAVGTAASLSAHDLPPRRGHSAFAPGAGALGTVAGG